MDAWRYPLKVYGWNGDDALRLGLHSPSGSRAEFTIMDDAARPVASAPSLEELRLKAEALGAADGVDPRVFRFRKGVGRDWGWVPTGEAFR